MNSFQLRSLNVIVNCCEREQGILNHFLKSHYIPSVLCLSYSGPSILFEEEMRERERERICSFLLSNSSIFVICFIIDCVRGYRMVGCDSEQVRRKSLQFNWIQSRGWESKLYYYTHLNFIFFSSLPYSIFAGTLFLLYSSFPNILITIKSSSELMDECSKWIKLPFHSFCNSLEQRVKCM